jgi:serine/threonine-protein kinase HipA
MNNPVEHIVRSARVEVNDIPAGTLAEVQRGSEYIFRYREEYNGPAVSLTMPTGTREYTFNSFPPFFDGLLPEGVQLDALLRLNKLDRNDLFAQLIAVGGDLVGAVTVRPVT